MSFSIQKVGRENEEVSPRNRNRSRCSEDEISNGNRHRRHTNMTIRILRDPTPERAELESRIDVGSMETRKGNQEVIEY